MINKVIITNYLNESLELKLTDPYASGILIRRIDGIGPTDADINVVELATADGGIVSNTRCGTRTISFEFDPLFLPDVETMRQKLYQYFLIKRLVTLRFITDNRDVTCSGYVQKCEPDIFRKDERVKVEVLCPDPFFYDSADGMEVALFSGITPLFEFKDFRDGITDGQYVFENEIGLQTVDDTEHYPILDIEYDEIQGIQIIPGAQNIVMSELVSSPLGVVSYEGEVETGIVLTITARGIASGLVLSNIETGESLSIDTSKIAVITGQAFNTGDRLVINTISGHKSAELVRSGVSYNIINCITRDSNWLQLRHGDNVFFYSAEEGDDNLEFAVQFRNAYQGV